MKTIIFAGGCFWGVEEYFRKIDGVLSTKVGYANGTTVNPTYEEVCTSATGHAEACYIEYDDKTTSLEILLEKFWRIVDPTIKDQQGPDIGNQYRTGIYYTEDTDKSIIEKSKEEEQKKYDKPIVTEIELLKEFYNAEEYHQDYLQKNPTGYCHIPKNLLQNP